MKRSEFFLIIFPFVILLGIAGYYEIKTGLIFDRVTLPALCYFFVVRLFVRSKRWWLYPVGSLVLFVLFLFSSLLFEAYAKAFLFGGGTLKLLAVVGMVLGIREAIPTGFLILGLMGIAHLTLAKFYGLETLPAVPLIFLASLLTLGIPTIIMILQKNARPEAINKEIRHN